MGPTLVLCLLIFGGCLMLDVHECSNLICKNNQYTITWPNNSTRVKSCLKCDTCHPGHGLTPPCGSHVPYPPKGIGCKQCVDGKTFSDELASAPCSSCHNCAKHEIVAANCTRNSDTKCSGICIQGYYFTKLHNNCQRCSYCCFDRKDEIQPECIRQGLNATNQHCSPRVDRNCGPDQTTMGNPNPAVTTPNSANNLVIILGVISSILFFILIVVVVWMSFIRRQKFQRRRIETENGLVELSITSQAQDLEAQQTPVAPISPRIQAVKQNEGFIPGSQCATPEMSPTGTPYDTEDEHEPLPETHVPKTSRRQNSKEAQNAKTDGANESLLYPKAQASTTDAGDSFQSGNSDQQEGNKGAEGGHQRKQSRSGSLSSRKLSFQCNDYQPLPGDLEDKGQSQGAEGGHQRKRSRSGSLQMFRKLSLPFSDYQLLAAQDPDKSKSESIVIEEHPISQTQKEGSRVELKCEVKSRKKVTFQWRYDGTKLQGQVNSTLVLDHVRLRDFGYYTCEVKTTDFLSYRVESHPAVLDVTPREGMKLKRLSDVFKDSYNVQEKVEKLLSKNIDGVGCCKRIAAEYKMDVDDLGSGNNAGGALISYLGARCPELTAYDFCKTLREPKIGRLDIVKELLDHLSAPQEQIA